MSSYSIATQYNLPSIVFPLNLNCTFYFCFHICRNTVDAVLVPVPGSGGRGHRNAHAEASASLDALLHHARQALLALHSLVAAVLEGEEQREDSCTAADAEANTEGNCTHKHLEQ